MVFIEDFEVFIQEAEELYRSNPLATRYCIKYRHCDGKLILKVTDDVKVPSNDSVFPCVAHVLPFACPCMGILSLIQSAVYTLQCLQFKTDQQQDLKKLERINQLFFALFSHGELPEGETLTGVFIIILSGRSD